MTEGVFGVWREPHLIDQLSPDQVIQSRIDSQRGEQVCGKPRPYHRRRIDGLLRCGVRRSMRAAIVACSVAGTLISLTSVLQMYCPRSPSRTPRSASSRTIS